MKVDGYDAYTFAELAPYNLTIPEYPTNDDWEALAQTAAGIALDPDSPKKPTATGAADGTSVISGLTAGLYLLVPHGSDIEDYVTTRTNEAGEEVLVTVARSSEYEYYFSPILVSLPTKEGVNGVDEINTADPTEWLYTGLITLKCEREVRFGDLLITKQLDAFDGSSTGVTFSFYVEAVLDGKVVYSNVEVINFTGPGTLSTLVKDLPVGAVVTVVEAEGLVPGYYLVAADAEPGVISSEEVLEMFFENSYEPTPMHGHSVVNTFEYEEGGWQNVAVYDGAE